MNLLHTLRLYFTTSYWKNAFSAWELLKGIMEGLGSIYVIVKLADWLAKDLVVASQKCSGWLTILTLLVAVGWGLYRIRPRRVVSCTLANRDVTLAVEIGDLFSTDETLVIGTNRTFDTEIADHLISPLSAQGQFTAQYYNGSHQYLDADIAQSLAGVTAEPITKPQGKQQRYPVGTVAMVRPKRKEVHRRAYLVAVAELNSQGRAHGRMEDLQTAMGSLWAYISDRGGMEPLRVPLLGTGFTRLTQQRSEIIRELLKSFIAACSERRFCESLTIVISYADYRKYNVDLDELGRYLTHVCKYADLRRPQDAGAGMPLAADQAPEQQPTG